MVNVLYKPFSPDNCFTNLSFWDLNSRSFLEKMVMGLRLTEGIILSEDDKKYINYDNFEFLTQKNFIKSKDDKIKLSLNGRLKMNEILKMIII